MSYKMGRLHKRVLMKVTALRGWYSLDAIAQETGNSPSWVKKLVDKKVDDPGARRLEMLEEWADKALCDLVKSKK